MVCGPEYMKLNALVSDHFTHIHLHFAIDEKKPEILPTTKGFDNTEKEIPGQLQNIINSSD